MKARFIFLLFAALTIAVNGTAQEQNTSASKSKSFKSSVYKALQAKKAEAEKQAEAEREAARQDSIKQARQHVREAALRRGLKTPRRKTRSGEASSESTETNTSTGTGSRPSSTNTSTGSGSRPSSSTDTGSGSRPSTSTGGRSGSSTSGSTGSSTNTNTNTNTNTSTGTGSRPSGTQGASGSRSGANDKQSGGNSQATGTAARLPGGGTKVTVESIGKYLDKNAQYDSKIALTNPAPAEADLPPYIKSGDKVFVLVKKEHDIRDRSEEIFAANYENIFPGAIIYADQSLAKGDPVLVGLPEGKVTLRVDFNTGNKSSSIKNVPNTADAVQDSIFALISNARSMPATALDYKSSYYSSAEEMAVGLNVNASFLNNKAKVNTNISQSEMHIYAVQNFTQKYYTVSITQESDKSKYFAPSVTSNDLDGKMWKSRGDGRDDYRPIAIITSVTYGRRAYKIYDYSTSSFKFTGDESLSLYGQKMSSTQDIAKNCESKNVWMYMDGTDPDAASSILTGSNIDSALENKLGFNPNTSQGVPLYYTVRFLASGSTISVQSTGSYSTLNYQELPTVINVTLRNDANGLAGSALKMRLDYKIFQFDANGNKVGAPRDRSAKEGYNEYVERTIDYGRKKTFKLDLKEGQFLDGPLYLQVRCKHSAAEDYHEDVSGDILPDQNGTIDITVNGNIRKGPAGKDAYIHSSSYTKLVGTKKDD